MLPNPASAVLLTGLGEHPVQISLARTHWCITVLVFKTINYVIVWGVLLVSHTFRNGGTRSFLEMLGFGNFLESCYIIQ